jgi:catechol 2,3-dioxygenase-like lactoylglutathione lyase family enzyme
MPYGRLQDHTRTSVWGAGGWSLCSLDQGSLLVVEPGELGLMGDSPYRNICSRAMDANQRRCCGAFLPVALSAVIGLAHFILYVADQAAATTFWTTVLDRPPSLNVPGMTEFVLSEGAVLGLMPEAGITALLGPAMPDPASARGVPRCELYVVVADPSAYHARAMAAGAIELSPLVGRSWGDDAAYCLDCDGHVIAFARRD